MPACNSLVGLPKDCGDNNLGAIKRALIASFEDVTGITVTTATSPDTDGTVTAITMAATTNFEEFTFPKDTSMFTQEWAGDMVADTHSYTQTVELGFRRIDLRKRNAVMLLAEGRRDLVVIVQDNNDDYWMLGSDQGMRLSANSMTTNNTRAAGQSMPVTLTSENERHMMYKVTSTLIPDLLP
jgi:hypothetical protein